MASPPVNPSEQARRLQEQIDELTRQWQDLTKAMSGRVIFTPVPSTMTAATPVEISQLPSALPPVPTAASVVPGWLNPILQGITILVVIGAALWVGQTTGTINTKIDTLQKSVDKVNDWKDNAAVSLGSLNTKVEGLTTSVDRLSKTRK